MRILALPNAFKGSLSALKTAHILRDSLSKKHQVKALPISDGGDGFIDFFSSLDPHAKLVSLYANNAFLKKRKTAYLMLSDGKTAIIETARICGLGRAKKEDLDPLNASSYGVGEVILAAANAGAKTIYIGLGGVACNDAGAGAAQAVGIRFLDKQKNELPLGAEPLRQLRTIDLSACNKILKNIKIYAVADVINPMLGAKGSARVFGPQKGATTQEVTLLEKALTVYARRAQKTTGKNIGRTQSTGAAGAIGAGLYAFFHAEFLLGADFLLQKAQVEKYIQWADLIITCEGKLDKQTFYGKAPLSVLKLAQKHHKPVLFICGELEKNGLSKHPLFPKQIAVLSSMASSKQDSLKHTEKYLRQFCKKDHFQ